MPSYCQNRKLCYLLEIVVNNVNWCWDRWWVFVSVVVNLQFP